MAAADGQPSCADACICSDELLRAPYIGSPASRLPASSMNFHINISGRKHPIACSRLIEFARLVQIAGADFTVYWQWRIGAGKLTGSLISSSPAPCAAKVMAGGSRCIFTDMLPFPAANSRSSIASFNKLPAARCQLIRILIVISCLAGTLLLFLAAQSEKVSVSCKLEACTRDQKIRRRIFPVFRQVLYGAHLPRVNLAVGAYCGLSAAILRHPACRLDNVMHAFRVSMLVQS